MIKNLRIQPQPGTLRGVSREFSVNPGKLVILFRKSSARGWQVCIMCDIRLVMCMHVTVCGNVSCNKLDLEKACFIALFILISLRDCQ